MTATTDVHHEIVAYLRNSPNTMRDDITDATRLAEDLGLDSLDVMALMNRFEERLGIRLDDEAVGNLKTVHDVIALIGRFRDDSLYHCDGALPSRRPGGQ